jgi:hypothetical protein
LTIDPNAWETYYQLALQQAEMHDITQAVQSITQAIHRHPTHISLWHLLTLLVSCPSQGDYKQALKTCDMGLAQTTNDMMDDENYELAQQHLMYQITRTHLLHAMHGPDAALESSETLFASFRKIAMPEPSVSTQSDSTYAGAHHGMIVSGSLGNLGELQMAAEKRRGRSASNSMLGHHHPDAGSRSYDNVLQVTPEVSKSTSSALSIGRARSASNLSANPSPLGPGAPGNQLLAVPDNGDVKPHHHHHLHGLNLFGSRSSSRAKGVPQQQQEGNYSIQSLPAAPYGKRMECIK